MKTTYLINLATSPYNYTEVAKVMSILLNKLPDYKEKNGVLTITFDGDYFHYFDSLCKVLQVKIIKIDTHEI